MSLSVIGTANSNNSATVTVPSGGSAPQSGDIIIFAEGKITATPPTMVLPTGFTQIASQSTELGIEDGGGILAYKVSDGTEGGTTITGLTASLGQTKLLLILRQSSGAITSVTINDVDTAVSAAAPSDQTITSGSGTTPLVALGFIMSDTHTRSFTPAETGSVDNTAFYSAHLLYKIYDSSPANVVAHMTDGGTNIMFTTYLGLVAVVATSAQMTVGSFTLSGQTTNGLLGTVAQMAAGAFTLTGQALSAAAAIVASLTAGAFSFTGVDISPTKILSAVMGAGAFVWTGIDMVFVNAYRAYIGVGEFVVRSVWHSPTMRYNTTNRLVNRKWWAKLLYGRN